MTKQTKTVIFDAYVYYEEPEPWDEPDATCFCFYGYELPASCLHGKVFVEKHTVAIEVPLIFDPRPQLIKTLEAEQRKAAADFEAATTTRMRKINELQALEMS